MKSGLLTISSVLISTMVLGQDSVFHIPGSVRSTDIIVGVHWQGNAKERNGENAPMYRYYEIGIGKGLYTGGVCIGGSSLIYISEEMYFGDKTIIGTKVGAWAHYLFDLGLALVYYTDFKKGNFKIRPEFGAGLGRVRFVVGYNIPTINNKAFTELSRNTIQVSIQLTIPVKQTEIKKQPMAASE
jgi:hypothetical protein